MRFEMLVPIRAADGSDRWFYAARQGPCVGDDIIVRWVGFTLTPVVRERSPAGGVRVICAPLGEHLHNALHENLFRPCPPPDFNGSGTQYHED